MREKEKPWYDDSKMLVWVTGYMILFTEIGVKKKKMLSGERMSWYQLSVSFLQYISFLVY